MKPAILIFAVCVATTGMAANLSSPANDLTPPSTKFESSGVFDHALCEQYLVTSVPRIMLIKMNKMLHLRSPHLHNSQLDLRIQYDSMPQADGSNAVSFFVDFSHANMLEHSAVRRFNLESVVDAFLNSWFYRNNSETNLAQELPIGLIKEQPDGSFVGGPITGRIVSYAGRERILIELKLDPGADLEDEARAVLGKLRAFGQL